jgi:virulence factor Mce-like protein
MRRALLLGALIAAAVVAGIVIVGPGTSSGYRFDAIFDTAQGMVAGQDVKVAGVRVGTIVGVHLTSDLKARMELQIDRRFAPFHDDASCRILPEGLISENYVECEPGTSTAPSLALGAGGVPTVPVTRTAEPVTLQQLLNIFASPTSDRLALMLNDLGVATAGQGENINAILRRANPALAQARRVLTIIDAQRRQIATAVGQSDQVLTQLAAGKTKVRSFVDNAATTAETTAAHRTALAASVQRLPALLTGIRRSFPALNDFSASATPLLSDLRAAAPSLTTLTTALPRFITAAAPAIRALGPAAAVGIAAAHTAGPVVADLNVFASRAGPAAKLLDQLLISLRDRGAIESILDFVYGLSVAGGTYDSLAHMATIDLLVPPCLSNQAAAGCDANFHRPAATAPSATATASARASTAATAAGDPQSASPLRGLLQYLLK